MDLPQNQSMHSGSQHHSTHSDQQNSRIPRSSMVDDSVNPYLLHHSDHPGMQIVSQVLSCDNYNSWCRSIKIALSSKNKFGFVDGSLPKPDGSDLTLLASWERNNQIVMSWLLNSMSKEIAASVIFANSAAEIWQDLHTRFKQQNGPRLFQLKKDLMNLVQGSMSVIAYFTKLKSIWEELKTHKPVSSCTCGGAKSLMEYDEVEFVLSFLMGLNDCYSHIRGQLLLHDPLPSINKAFSLVLQEEKQKEVTSTIPVSQETQMAFAVKTHSDKPRVKKDRPQCSHCGFLGHTVDKCYKLHGYPPGYKPKGKSNTAVNIVTTDNFSVSDPSTTGSTGLTAQQYQNLVSMLTTQLSNATKPVATTSEPVINGGISCTVPNPLHAFPNHF